VFADCWDPPHESERPFTPSDTEGMPRYPVAPENLPASTTVIAGVVSLDVTWEDDPLAWEIAPAAWLVGAWLGAGATLLWTRPDTVGPRFERYEVFRSVSGAAFALLGTNEIAYSLFGGITNTPEEYIDAALTSNTTNRYYIEAVTGNGRRVRSNTIELAIGALS
jgi:hypothetical protein